MSLPLTVSTFGLLAFLLLGLVLVALLRGLRLLARRLPISRARAATVDRAVTVVEALAGIAYLLSAVPMVLDDHPELSPILAAAVLAAVAAMAWLPLRDGVQGVFFKASHDVREGDHLRVGALAGVVRRRGYRALLLETAAGDEVTVPYSRLTRAAVVRTPAVPGTARHVFEVALPPGVEVPAARDAARLAAFHAHMASVARDARVALAGPGRLEVTAYVLEAAHGPGVEARVREAVAALALASEGPAPDAGGAAEPGATAGA